jgi:hypothetical protein
MSFSGEMKWRPVPAEVLERTPKFLIEAKGLKDRGKIVLSISQMSKLRHAMGLAQILDFQLAPTPGVKPIDLGERSKYRGRVLHHKFCSFSGWHIHADECQIVYDKLYPQGKLHRLLVDRKRQEKQVLYIFADLCRRAAEHDGVWILPDRPIPTAST